MMGHPSHPLDVLEARLTMDDASHSGSDYASSSSDFASAEEEAAAAAAAEAAFQEFVYTSPKPGLQLPSTPLSALRSGPKNSPGLSAFPPSPVGTGIGLTFPPISPVSLNAPPPSPIGLLELQMHQHGGLLPINTSHVVSPVKPENGDYEHFLTALNAQPLSPARSLSSCSMSNSLSSSSLSSLSTSASYGSSLASYASSYNAPPNTFPYNLANRPESPAAQQPIPAPMGLNPAHVNPGALHLSSPTKRTYPHLSPGPTPTLAVNQDGRAPSPIPSPTSASAAITLIGVGSTPQQQPTQYSTLMRPTTPQTPISATAAMSISNSKGYVEDACAQTQLQASTKRRREASEQGLLHHERDVPVPSASGVELSQHQPSPSKRSATGSPEKRNAVSSSGGSSTSGSSSAKSSLKTEIWPDDVEAAFMEALKVIPKLGRRKVMINGKPCGRNELIADYIRRKTLKIRTRKQVSSHIQVLKNLKRNDQEFMNLVTENMDDIEGFPAALLQAGFHMAQLPCLKTDIIVPHFTLGGGLPTLGHLSASPMSLHQAMNGNPLLGNTLPGPPLSGSSDVSFENMQASMPYPNYYFGSFQQPPHQQQQLQSQQQSLSQFPQQDEGSSSNVFQNGHHGMLGPALYDNESHTASV